MEWTDEAIVLGVRKHGETTVIAELMTRDRGRHLGLVQGGRSRTMRPVLQPGNSVRVTWRARLVSSMPRAVAAARMRGSARLPVWKSIVPAESTSTVSSIASSSSR